MAHIKIALFRAIRDLIEVVWPKPDWWFYWDNKVLAERAKVKHGKV